MPGARYTSISDYLGANQGTLADERAKLSGVVGGELDDAKKTADQVVGGVGPGTDYTTAPGYGDARAKEDQAQKDAGLLGTYGGLAGGTDVGAGLLARTYGDSTTQARFDAGLLQGSPSFSDVKDKGKSLTGYLDKQSSAAAGTPAPLTTPQEPGHSGAGAKPGSSSYDPWATGVPEGGQQGYWSGPNPAPSPQPRGPGGLSDDTSLPGQIATLPMTIVDYLGGYNQNADSPLAAVNGKGFSRGGKGIHYGPDGQPINPEEEEP